MFNGANLLNTLGINNHTEIEEAIESHSPSMVEYYITESLGEIVASPRSNYIQHVTNLDNYKIFVDYNDEITIQVLDKQDDLTSCLF